MATRARLCRTWLGALAHSVVACCGLLACGGTHGTPASASGDEPEEKRELNVGMQAQPRKPAREVALTPNANAGEAPVAPTPLPTDAPAKKEAGAPSFPPANFNAPFPGTAADGDGQWRPVGDPTLSESAAGSPATVLQTVLHPHAQRRYVSMTVVALDLEALKLSWVVGSKDLHAERLGEKQTPGLVPARDQENAVLVFNGGFQAQHGWWGMMSDGVTLVEPKAHGCTLAIFGDETVRIAPFTELEAERSKLQSFRQSPPCLLHGGEIHPELQKGNLRNWAGQKADLKTRRRSAAGLSKDGRTLYYAIGNETEATDLARGLQAAGAHDGMQLDINWAWARMLLVGRVEGKPRLTSSLLPEALYGKSECFARPSERDFFYVSR